MAVRRATGQGPRSMAVQQQVPKASFLEAGVEYKEAVRAGRIVR